MPTICSAAPLKVTTALASPEPVRVGSLVMRSLAEAKRIKTWWRRHREAAPDLFEHDAGEGPGAWDYGLAFLVDATDLRRVAEWTGTTVDEIQARLGELREEVFNLRFRNSMKQLDNPLRIRESRREMARLLTVLADKEPKPS